jgi:hypothetical protein
MKRLSWLLAILVVAVPVLAQETPSAQSARKKLQQKISVEWKDIGVKAITDDIKREMDQPVAFKIDNTTGVSNNAKLTYKADNKTVEQILNDLSEKGEFGWFVKSDPKDRNDGWVIIRKYKDKERGVEGGNAPAKGK